VTGKFRLLERNLPQYDIDEARQLAVDYYGVDGDFRPLSSERDCNFHIEAVGGQYVLKISNEADDEDIVDFQVAALRHIRARDATLPVPEVLADRDGRHYRRITGSAGRSNIVRLMSYLPGTPAKDAQVSRRTCREIGRLMGRMDVALANFYHHAARKNDHPWDTSNCLRYQQLVEHIDAKDARATIDGVFNRFREDIKPRLDATRHQIIHHDAHSGNVIVDSEDHERIAGLIDFGDMVYGPIVADLAVAADVTSEYNPDLLQIIADVATGFDEECPLTEDEIDLVFDVLVARYALTATVTASRNALLPGEPRHLHSWEPYVAAIERLLSIGYDKAIRELRRSCRFPVYCPPSPEEATTREYEDELLRKRYRFMGSKTKHFYQRPIHFERARGVYLYATDGHRYLDCYNNVPQVGHCNPHVVRAIARQASALNTNTRYLYSSILEYAERLTDKLAPHLDSCLFVNSGSEANDVAWQMARIATGRTGGLLMEDAYHGITGPMREFSPGHPDIGLPPYLRGLLAPDTYRGPYRGETPDAAERYAADADRAIDELAHGGHEIAAFIIDSAMCSSGVLDPPRAYLREVEKRVRAAGGMMICDEVQSGFGRMGEWWGHEYHGVKADIVTMGKPVGNGHPLGVVVTSAEVLGRFLDATGLFSTFGGNTVACAAGNAVLDVIERDGLIENGCAVGDYLRRQLRELAKSRPLIGDVRGHGMLTGVELVNDRDQRNPAKQETQDLLELMRERHVLVGRDGRDGNVLKLRPPLIFERGHADQLITALDSALAALAGDQY